MRELLAKIREGMEVYDRVHVRVGTVRDIYLGNEPGAVTTPAPREPHSLLQDVLNSLAPPGPPETVRARLLAQGFICIDAGTFAADRYAWDSQIRAVTDAGVLLDVDGDELLRR
jgi:hypothetical protein